MDGVVQLSKYSGSMHSGLQSSSTKHGSSSVSGPLGQVLLRVFVLSLHFSPAHSLHVDHGSHICVVVVGHGSMLQSSVSLTASLQRSGLKVVVRILVLSRRPIPHGLEHWDHSLHGW